jgi:hypothetical protein
MGGAVLNAAAATTEMWWPSDGTNPVQRGVWVDDVLLTVTFAQQTANGAKVDIYLYVLRG